MITAFVNGSVFDGHRHRRRRGPGRRGRRYHGPSLTARLRCAEDADRVVDLGGGLAAPGFTDAHVHAVQGGLERIRCDLSDLTTRAQYLARIAAYAARTPELPWILGGGWSMAAFPGNTADRSRSRRPRARPAGLPGQPRPPRSLGEHSGSGAGGIDARTDDPDDGHFDSDAEGNPTGTLHEGAMSAVTPFMPVTDPDEFYAGLLEGQRYLHALGVTGWQDAILGDYAGINDPARPTSGPPRRAT